MPDFSLCHEPAHCLASRVRAQEISPTELARLFLAAIERFNPEINAVVTVDPAFTLAQASDVERRLARGELEDAPLAGVPYLAKDLDVTSGLRTTFGSKLHKEYVPKWDMFHVERLRRAGLVLLGKTNTPEDGAISNTYNGLFGATRNPWRLDRCAGGSSGGAAAAVAAGLAPLATGSDGAGSIRIPAALCGCFGFKPTFGSIPFGPKGIGAMNTIGHLGPLSRCAVDAAIAAELMSGGDERDRASLPSLARTISDLDSPLGALRVAYSVDLGYAEVDPEIRAAFLAAIEKLRAAGWTLDEARPDFADPRRASDVLVAVEWGSAPAKLMEADPERYELQEDYVRAMAELRRSLTLDDLWEAYEARKSVCVAMGEFFERYALLLTPSAARTAFELDRPFPSKIGGEADDLSLNALMYPFNLTGDPACSLPIGLSSEGLPIGLQAVAPRHKDRRALVAAYAFERLGLRLDARPPHGVL